MIKQIVYSGLRVIDGDTIEIRLWPSGLSEVCRIEGIDCDESGTKRGERQTTIAKGFMCCHCFKPYVFVSRGHKKRTGWEFLKRCGRGRLLVRVYVWKWFRYVDYSKIMLENGDVKKGSKWNEIRIP